jgi:hypothetical protein
MTTMQIKSFKTSSLYRLSIETFSYTREPQLGMAPAWQPRPQEASVGVLKVPDQLQGNSEI